MIRLGNFIACTYVTLVSLLLYTEALGAVSVLEINFHAKDAVYDSSRNLIYASVSSSAGEPNGNSILTINPANLEILSQKNAGSEPAQLAISYDNSRVYVGVNGSRAFRSFIPESGELGPLIPLYSRLGDPAVAEDIAVSLTNPTVVVVSKDEVGSTAGGDLEVFDDSGSIGK